ncbi:MAG: winged helix-turn-helix transcriptional regulator [Rhodocyclaceae bacterium]|nr:winged helix-turn-helix transcriptional regulator [Rhodocyclaceae bacterium]
MNPSYSRSIPSEWQGMSKIFIALGDEHRQRILLMFEPGERLTVNQIAGASALSRPAVSHHLKILREAEILQCTKEGKQIWHWVDHARIADCLRAVLNFVEPAP